MKLSFKKFENVREVAVLVFLLLSFVFAGCPNAAKKPIEKGDKNENLEKFVITFGASSVGATVEAEVDGNKINSGDKVQKGKIVTFTAKLTDDIHTVSSWSGAAEDATDKKTARLFVMSAADVRVNLFSPLINFIKTSGGTQKGADSDITQEQAKKIILGKFDTVVEFKGPNISIVLGSTEKTWEADSFKVNGEKKIFLPYGELKSAGIAILTVNEVNKEIPIKAEARADGKTHQISFKIKRVEGKVDVPKLHLVIDNHKPNPMEADTLQKLFDGVSKPVFNSGDPAKIEIQTTGDYMKSVTVTPLGGSALNAPITVKQLPAGKVWYAEVNADGASEVPGGKEFKVEITPKDTENYEPVVWTFKLKAKGMKNNAEFQGKEINGSFEPSIMKGLKWYNSPAEHQYIDDYGAVSVKFTAHTVSKNASVFYQIVGRDKKPLQGQSAKMLTNNLDSAHSHTSEEISLFNDKPTYIKLWVVAADGTTTDENKGAYVFPGNPAGLMLGYEFNDDPNEIRKTSSGYKEAYDVAEIERSKVTDNKVWLAFNIWDSFTVAETGLPPHQKKFVKLSKTDDKDAWLGWYITEVDVTSLTDNTKTLEVLLPILDKGAPCFTYKVTVKLAN